MQRFLFKLIPPRSSFAQDMDDGERNLMQEHAAYWNHLLGKRYRTCLWPSLRSKRILGMAIIEVENEAAAKGLALNDPTIKANLHTFEIHPRELL